MSSIDQRIVDMKFNNGQFQKGVEETSKSLDKLKDNLKLDGATKGLNDLSNAGKNFSLSGIADGVESISSKFSVLGAVGFTVIQNLTNAAMGFGKKMVGTIMDPIVEGGKKRSLSIEQAKFQFKGLGMDVEKSMDSALKAVDGTAYGLDEAAVVAAQFGASGMKAGDEMTASLRGIAGVAAMSGSSYSDVGRTFTKVAGQGRLMGDDLNSMAARGVNAAATLGKSMGKTEAEIRKMVTKGEIDFKTFSNAMNDAFGEHATKANETYTGSLSNVRSALGRIGAAYYEYKYEALRKFFVGLTPVINNVKTALMPAIDALGKFMDKGAENSVKWMEKLDLSPLTAAVKPTIGIIKNLYTGLMSILKPIKEAFLEIFPPASADQIKMFLTMIGKVTSKFKMGEESANKLKSTFKGLFALFDIGIMIVSGVVGVIADLIGASSGGVGAILGFTGGIGDWIVSVRDALKKGEGLTKFFEGLSNVIKVPIEFLKTFATSVKDAVKGDFGMVGEGLEKRFSPLKAIGSAIVGIFKGLWSVLKKIGTFLLPLGTILGDMFGNLSKTLTDSLKNMDFSLFLDTINTILLTALTLMTGKFMKNFKGGFFDGLKDLFGKGDDSGGGFLDSIKEAFGGLTDTLSAMQANLKAGTLLKIAGAVGVLTASVVALSLIDSAKLAKALSAITVMMLQLVGAMAIMNGAGIGKGFARLPIIAGAMILLAIAVDILAIAVAKLGGLSWEELAKGLTGVGVALGAFAGFTHLAKVNKGAVAQSASLILLATAILILSKSVEKFGNMDVGQLIKGLAAMAIVLAQLAIFANVTGDSGKIFATAAALVVVAAAMKIFASVVEKFGNMSWEELARGLVGLAGALVIVAGAMWIMPPNMVLTVASLVVVAAALNIIAAALKNMGGMSWEEIGKGLVVLAGSLVIIAGAMYLMTAALPGAAALIIVAGALAILTPVLLALAGLTWGEVAIGLTMLAGALTVIGIAGLLLTPVVPTLVLLGAAIALLGIGALAAGAGMLAFSAGFAALAAAAAVGTVAIVGMITAIVGLIPMAMRALGEGILEFAAVISTGGPAITSAFVTVLESLINAVVTLTPQIISALVTLVFLLVDTLVAGVPRLIRAGLTMLNGILSGIADNIQGIVTEGLRIITNFIKGVSDGLPGVIDAGADLVIKFVNSVASTIESKSGEMNAAGARLGWAIADGMTGGLASKAREVAGKAAELANNAFQAAKNALDINSPSRKFMELGKSTNEGFAKGMTKYANMSTKAGAGVGESALSGARKALDINSPSKAFAKIGKYANEGFAKGLRGSKDDVRTAYKTMRGYLKDAIKSTESDMKKFQEKLNKAQKAKKKSPKKIKEAQKNLAQSKQENKAAKSAHKTLVKNLNDERLALEKLANKYGRTSMTLDEAKKNLEDMKKTRDDYNSSITDQYSKLNDIGKDTRYDSYTEKMRKQIKETKTFASVMQNLRKKGLNDDMYKELLAKGPDALPFAKQVQSGGKKSIKELNSLTSQLNSVAKKLGKSASSALYQAGVDSAAGLVRGLKKSEGAIDKQMNRLANKMVKTVKSKLGIKSPSREFAKIGVFSNEGLARGLMRSSGLVEKAANNIGEDTIESLRKSISNAQIISASDMQIDPTIRPVLDLSDVKKGVNSMGSMFGNRELNIEATRSRAESVNLDSNEKLTDTTDQLVGSSLGKTFIQNIYSPRAVSQVDLYRQSKNLLSLSKG